MKNIQTSEYNDKSWRRWPIPIFWSIRTVFQDSRHRMTAVISWRNTGLDSIKLPREAMIHLSWKTVISQRWLQRQRPPTSFTEAGGIIYDRNNPYFPEQQDPKKMQCWLMEGIWYWNKKWGQWLAGEMWGDILSSSDLHTLYTAHKWMSNIDTMKKMGISQSGYFSASDSKVLRRGDGILRSSDPYDNDNTYALYLLSHEYHEHHYCVWNSGGSVLFISWNTSR